MPRTSIGAIAFSLLQVGSLAGCTSWQVSQSTPAELLDKHPGQVRVERQDASRVLLTNPSLVGDTLMGENGGRRTGVPLQDVQTLSTHRFNAGRTVVLLLAGVGVAAIVVVATGDQFGNSLY